MEVIMQTHNSHQRRPLFNRAHIWKSLGCAVLLTLNLARLDTASATIVYNATIQGVTVDRALGNFAYIKLSIAPTGLACGTATTFSYTLPFYDANNQPANQQLYALLLTAYMSGKAVSVVGTGACTEDATVESLRGLNVIG
jgi:hypothetical protein